MSPSLTQSNEKFRFKGSMQVFIIKSINSVNCAIADNRDVNFAIADNREIIGEIILQMVCYITSYPLQPPTMGYIDIFLIYLN